MPVLDIIIELISEIEKEDCVPVLIRIRPDVMIALKKECDSKFIFPATTENQQIP